METKFFLVEAKELRQAISFVHRFLENTTLIKFEFIEFTSNCYNASQEKFFTLLNRGISKNKKILDELIFELSQEGYTTIEDLSYIPQGYISKLVHVIAHFLDGFVGIDSYFFNIVESSHWVSKTMLQKIKKEPNNYWILEVNTKLILND